MWFKNLLLYRFTSPFDMDQNALEDALGKESFTPCGRHDQSKSGWVSPMGELSELHSHSANGCLLVCLKKEEKILPAGVIREKLDDKIREIEDKEDRKVYSKEKTTLKDDIIHDCLPQAFTRSNRSYAYIDVQNGWLCIDASSSGKAEELMKKLREALGSLSVIPVQVSESPQVIMSQWLKDARLPEGLLLGQECELKELSEDGSQVRCKNQDLLSEEVEQHLDAGKKVSKLALNWRDELQFILQEDLAIKRLKFSEQLINEAEDSSGGDKAAQFDADFAIMTLTFKKWIPELLNYFGELKAEPV